MISKGYHYSLTCDSPLCDKMHIIQSTRHGVFQRRDAKQTAIKLGWKPGLSGTVLCPDCIKEKDERNAKIIADNIKKSRDEEGSEAPAENLEGVEL